MAVSVIGYNKFNRGELDPLALARFDVEKINNSSSLMQNFLPIRLGPMMFRPGLGHIAELEGETSNFMVPFVRSISERAILAFQGKYLTIYTIDDNNNVTLVPGDDSTTTITNGDFASNTTGWTDNSGGSATTAWTADKNGCASLLGTGTDEARLYQTLSTDTGAEHVLRVVVKEAPIILRLGTSGANSKDIFEGELKPGVHYLNFTPASNVTITMANSRTYRALVGLLDFPTELKFAFDYTEFDRMSGVTGSTISKLKWTQSADIVFFALDGVPQFQVERRGTKSWSIVEYRCNDGPFGLINNSDITLTPAALSGNTTLTASRAYFSADSVGELFKLVSAGQQRTASVTAQDNGTGSIRVAGAGAGRRFIVNVFGTFSASVTLQRSADDSTWEDVEEYTAYTYKTFDDTLDNAIYYYRLHVKTGDFVSGTVGLLMDYPGGSIEGICRVTAYTSATVVSIQVLTAFGATSATRNWYRTQWSSDQGYPSSVELYEGRLCFAGNSQFWASVSDAYDSHDRSIEGNSAAIYRTIGFGPTDSVNWLKKGIGLVLSIMTDQISVRSTTYGEALTNTNTNLKSGNTQGSSSVPPERSDRTIYFVHRNTKKLFGLNQLDLETFETQDLTLLNPSICSPGIVRIAVSRQPETRVWAVMADGTMRVFLIDETENVAAWSRITTDGDIKDVISIPGNDEAGVYVVVRRDNQAGGDYYLLERLASFDNAIGGSTSETFDAFVTLSSPGTSASVSGSPALVNRAGLGVWADGQYRGTFAASGSTVTLPASWNSVTIGIPYQADYTSNKLFGYKDGIPLNERRRVVKLGLITRDMWYNTLTVSGDGSTYQSLPAIENGKAVTDDATIAAYDEPMFHFPGDSDTDPRVYIRATGPVTILALTHEIEYPTLDEI